MAPSELYTTIEGRKLKLTNPDKLLFPESKLVKAEYIKYLLDISPYLIPLIKNRPLTLIRYPDGISGKKFYSKNKPSWTPKWIGSVFYPEDVENEYLIVKDTPTVAWIGNLAALEIHPMNVRTPNLLYPDQFIFDLDPSSEVDFEQLKNLAWNLKHFLEKKGFVPFIKTSGGKGLHIYVPIKPLFTVDEVYKFTKRIAQEYVRNHDQTTTLKISKAKRKGKVLLDIYRNAKAQSCVAPYSTRAKPLAPVSTPFEWSFLEHLPNSQHWNMLNVLKFVNENGCAWENFKFSAVSIKEKHKTKNLKKYEAKRDFSVTSEPIGKEMIKTSGHDFVIQLHDASNLHYDLRLEENGTLKSWAIPKGLPMEPGVKRLSIQTEDHPLKYLEFEGNIPKNEYGGGTMWIFDRGTYTLIKKGKSSYHFILEGNNFTGEWKMYQTKKNQWLIERKDLKNIDFSTYLRPMLADQQKTVPSGKEWFYEIKWDGIRAIFLLVNGTVKVYSRNGNNLTSQFPKIQIMKDCIEAEIAILDGEIVNLDKDGKPLFHKVVGRMHTKGKTNISQAAKHTPVVVYLFDLLYLDGRDCRNIPNNKRRAWLQTILETNKVIRLSETFEDGTLLFEAIKKQGMEGIMAKKANGKYQSGKRSAFWKKIKVRHTDTAWIIGYTEGEGDRSGSIGAIHLAKYENEEWRYMGKVGTGFNTTILKKLGGILFPLDEVDKPIKESIEEPDRTKWIGPYYQCRILYASLSSNGTYREPVFQEWWKKELNP